MVGPVQNSALDLVAHVDAGISAPGEHATASGRRWILRKFDPAAQQALQEFEGVSPVLARVMAARGVMASDADAFLAPSLKRSLPDPHVLHDMAPAALRLAAAVQAGETIGIFGDYDVDGTCAAALLFNYLKQIDASAIVHLPDRATEGYGPSAAAFESLAQRGAGLIVTVDCGASAHEPVSAAAALGLDVVILDHHLMDGAGPQEALAIVNPHGPEDRSGLVGLSASGLAFLAVIALNRALRDGGFFANRAEPDLRTFLDLAAIGLVCDVMPITGLTRVIVAQGLKIMGAGSNGDGNPGLRALAEVAGAKTPYSTYTFGFQIGPRINAAGRIGHAQTAFDLLTTDNQKKRAQLAEELHVLNAARQEIEANVQREAIALIDRKRLADAPVIVVAGEGWASGVVGIVAGRIKEIYDRPTVVIGLENGVGKGSGRSITGVDLGRAISSARDADLLVAGGGHEMAAGLTVAEAHLPEFTEFLITRLADDVARAMAGRKSLYDGVIGAGAANRAFVDDMARAAPYGPGNPEPIFMLSDLAPIDARPVGVNHLAVTLLAPGGETIRGIAFRAVGERLGDILSTAERVHVLGKLKADEWRGGGAVQLQISDAAIA